MVLLVLPEAARSPHPSFFDALSTGGCATVFGCVGVIKPLPMPPAALTAYTAAARPFVVLDAQEAQEM
eukprot:5711929-Lingulodinium_polyedra.AAC.1